MADYEHKFRDMQNILESMRIELLQSSRLADNELESVISVLRQDMQRSIRKQEELLDAVADLQERVDVMMRKARPERLMVPMYKGAGAADANSHVVVAAEP